MKKVEWKMLLPFAITMPAILIGAWTMGQNQISMGIWLQNIIFGLVFACVSAVVIYKKRIIKENDNILYLALGALLLTFLGRGSDGVHRWFGIAGININVAMVILPIVIIQLYKTSEKKKWLLFNIMIMIYVAVLGIQPDASQLTAFALSMLIVVNTKENPIIWRAISNVVLIVAMVLVWVYLDPLEPVMHVDKIVNLLVAQGTVPALLGIMSLAILPVPFLFFTPKNENKTAKGLGVYFAVVILSTVVGNFPVPLMGYGFSSMLGYFTAITWYGIKKSN